MMKFLISLLSLLPMCVMASSFVVGIMADGDSKAFSIEDVVSIKVDDVSGMSVRSKSGNVDGGFSVIEFTDKLANIFDNNVNLAIKVYPNPVKSLLYFVGADAETKFEIFTSTGKVVMKGEGESVNVSNLASGQYVIVVDGKSVKFIKE